MRRLVVVCVALLLGTLLVLPPVGCESPNASDSGVPSSATTTEQPGPTAPDAMQGANSARTGDHLGPGPSESPQLLWQFDHGSLERSKDTVAWDGLIFHTWHSGLGPESGGALYVLDAETGEELWSLLRLDADNLAVSDGVLLFTSAGFLTDLVCLYAFDARTGEEKWRFEHVHDVRVADGVVYATGFSLAAELQDISEVDLLTQVSGFICALDAETGQVEWRVDEGPGVYYGRLVVSEGVVYTSRHVMSGKLDAPRLEASVLCALDAKTGQEEWSLTQEGLSYNVSCVAGGSVYVEVFDRDDERRLYALDARDGSERWSYKDGVVLAVSGENVCVTVWSVRNSIGNALLHVLDAETGREKWSMWPGRAGIRGATCDGTLYLVESTADRKDPARPLIGLRALDASTGKESWAVDLSDYVVGNYSPGSMATGSPGAPAISEGVIYVTDAFGGLYALGVPADSPTTSSP